MEEYWRTVVIDGVEHPRYQVSNMGRVKCLNWNNACGEKIVCQSIRNKYFRATIDGKCYSVHRIVCETFHPNVHNKSQVDHIDGNRQNNCEWNLRWTTPKENSNNPITKDNLIKSNAGTAWVGKFGADNKSSVSVVQLSLDGTFIKKWGGISEAARCIGISNSSIIHCLKGRYSKAGGYKWKYDSDYKRKSILEIKPLF